MKKRVLSDREHEVLQLVAGGSTNKEIAVALQISAYTVQKHVSSVLLKLNTVSRTEACAHAIREQLID
ncbi:MAG: response regulator transcription factor [Chloroflexi bacterium]|nr:response regulator transcription factor [Chloroflexota bacterium]